MCTKMLMNICITLCRDSSNDGQGDTVSLSMSVSELDDSGEGKGKKKRGRPGKQGVRSLLLSRSTDCIYLNHKCMLSATLPDLSLLFFFFFQAASKKARKSPVDKGGRRPNGVAHQNGEGTNPKYSVWGGQTRQKCHAGKTHYVSCCLFLTIWWWNCAKWLFFFFAFISSPSLMTGLNLTSKTETLHS